ncbi:MAG: thioredoxin domain-containing protein [Bradymonadales bacterium]|nr:thioredoxin domain-containing protein [Bradymonadales bacterium]
MSTREVSIDLQGKMAGPASGEETAVAGGALAIREPPRKLAIAFLVCCLLGLAASIELTRIHVFVHTDPSYHSVCAMSEGVNCETVAISPYSVFAGLPVSVWGIAGYLLMGGLALAACVKRSRRPRSTTREETPGNPADGEAGGGGSENPPPKGSAVAKVGDLATRTVPTWPFGLLLLLTCFSVVVSVVLATISATRIDSLCLFCMTSYAINVLLLVLCLIAWRKTRAGTLQLVLLDLKTVLTRPLLFVPLALVGLGSIGALRAAVPPYWETPGWNDLPRLASGTDENGHHWIGAANPTLTIVEFSDYECPHCRAAHKDIRLLAAQHPDRIRLVHRHLPLDQQCHPGLRRPFHRYACRFAEAAECAALQGRFWDMNDALFSIQDTVRTDDVDPEELAVRLGLNRLEFQRCLENQETTDRVAADLEEAMRRNLRGTPSFLVGNQLFLGRIPQAELDRLLSEVP